MEVGVNGAHGQSVPSAVEEELKVELEFAITQFLNLVAKTVLLMGRLIWKLKHAMKILVQLTEDGEIGPNGMSVQLLVEELTKEELEFVTILHHNLGVMIAQLMDRLIQKRKDATKILVQLMEDSVIGMSGDHVRQNVEEETRQDQEDATIQYR